MGLLGLGGSGVLSFTDFESYSDLEGISNGMNYRRYIE